MITVEKGNMQMSETDNAIETVVNVDDMQNP
jgi:hypothetical protein